MAILLLSLAFYVGAIGAFFCYSRALNWDTSAKVFIAFAPVVYVIEALPISLNGLGVREGAIVYLFGKAGVPASEALSLALLLVTFRFLLGLIGGAIFALRGSPALASMATRMGGLEP
jgi:hypothetical protein